MRFSAMSLIIIGCSSYATAQCRPPGFKKGRDYGATVHVSLTARDFNVANLVCIVKTLQRKRQIVQVLFFTSAEAAQNFVPSQIEAPPEAASWAKDLHADYVFESEKRAEYLLLTVR
jgi:hypothetical protein